MGANLCCMNQSSSGQEPEDVCACDQNFNVGPSSSIMDSIKQENIREEKEKRQLNPPVNKVTITGNLTLQDCLLASPALNSHYVAGPGLNPHYLTGSEVQIFRQLYKKVYPSCAETDTDFFTPNSSDQNNKLALSIMDSIRVANIRRDMGKRQMGSPEKKVYPSSPEIHTDFFMPNPSDHNNNLASSIVDNIRVANARKDIGKRQMSSPERKVYPSTPEMDTDFFTPNANDQIGIPASSIMYNSKNENLRKEMEKRQMNPLTVSSTLEECILASPGLNPYCLTGVELELIKQLYKKIYLSSPEVQTSFFTPRVSFSTEKLGNLRKIVEEEDAEELTLSRSRSERLGKRVSFRLPEQSDIIILPTPEEKCEE